MYFIASSLSGWSRMRRTGSDEIDRPRRRADGGLVGSARRGRERVAQPGVKVARDVAELRLRLVVLRPVRDVVGGADRLAQVGREAHHRPYHGTERRRELGKRGGKREP